MEYSMSEVQSVSDGNVTVSAIVTSANDESKQALEAALAHGKAVDKGGEEGHDDGADRRNAGEEGDTASPNAKNGDDKELAENADDSEDGEHEDEGSKPRKKGGWQRRVDKLTQKLNEMERYNAQLREVALAAVHANRPTNDGNDTQGSQGPAKPAVDPNAPKIEDFEELADYMAAVTEYKVEQRFAKQAEEARNQEIHRQAESIQAKFKERAAEAAKRYPDFAEAKKTDLPLTVTVRQVILESEVGPDMVYWMTKNPEAAMKIMQSPPVIQAKELGKLEDKILAQVKGAKGNEGGAAVSKAPKPITHGVGGSRGSSSVKPEEMDYQTYKAYRENQLKAAGKSIR